MTEKMYYNLRKKYNNSVFLILKIYKAFSNFDFNSTTWKKIHWVVNCLEISHRKDFVNSHNEHPN